MGTYPPYYAYPSAPPVVRAVPDPPRLHWGWVLLLSIITFNLFGMAWLIVQANWVRKVYGRSKALPWAIAYASILPAFFLFVVLMSLLGAFLHVANVQAVVAVGLLLTRLAFAVLWIVTIFTLRGELSAEPIDIPLGGIMTFFFGPLYFQYHLSDYEVSDEVHQFHGPLRTDLEPTPESSVSEA
jgi:hypothetical protein